MDNIHWMEVSLVVDGELAEAVAEVLARFAPDGVAVEMGVQGCTVEGEGIPDGSARVCAYLPADDQLPETRQRLEQALWFLGRIRPLPEAQYRQVETADWAESWKQHFQPIAIGRRLMIVPAWLEAPEPQRIAVKIDPGMAFGTGTHPTTQLCLELLEAFMLDKGADGDVASFSPPVACEVIDVGCGSGILSIAALKLGARHALGVDLDEQAIRASRENSKVNGVSERLELGLGSLAEILAGKFFIRQAPLVLANILAPVIIRLLHEGLGELVEAGGWLVLSGILEEQAADVETALSQHGLRVIQRKQSGDWVALAVEKRETG